MAVTGLHTSGADLADGSGQHVRLRGVNWFGFNSGTTMVDGLWGDDPLTADFATVVHRQMLLGFNAVRLPFSFKDLHTLPPRDFRRPCPRLSDWQIAASVLPPGVLLPEGIAIPPLPAPPPPSSTCNGYLPSDSTLSRFLWAEGIVGQQVAAFYAANGFTVLLDNHLMEDPTAAEDPAAWVQHWAQLAGALVAQSPALAGGALLLDLLNEPDHHGLRYERQGDKPGLKELYLAAMDAIHDVAPRAIFLLEGTGQQDLGANRGDGFCCDAAHITSHGLSDPNPLFRAILQKPYREQVVLSPHVYGPAVTHAPDRWAGAALHRRLSQSFGWATQQGYSDGAVQKLFQVIIGEFGSFFKEESERQMMADFGDYLNGAGAHDGLHRPISSWFYWCWNCNSGDTGGLVATDWGALQWPKIAFLTSLGLRPWFTPWASLQSVMPQSTPSETSTGQPAADACISAPTPQSSQMQAGSELTDELGHMIYEI